MFRKLTDNHNLQALNPSLSKEWHPDKNAPLKPNDVLPSAAKKVWWICNKGHEWKATINHRSHGRGCPYCSGKLVCEDNSLLRLNSDLAKEWHPIKNEQLTPKDVTVSSGKKVWWICKEGHEWKAKIAQRNNGTGCPLHCHQTFL